MVGPRRAAPARRASARQGRAGLGREDHIATAPVYYHNYALGPRAVAGRYLLEAVFGPGAREDWRDTVQRATGESMNPQHFVRSLA